MAGKKRAAPKIPIRGGFDVLPHNMGPVPKRTRSEVASIPRSGVSGEALQGLPEEHAVEDNEEGAEYAVGSGPGKKVDQAMEDAPEAGDGAPGQSIQIPKLQEATGQAILEAKHGDSKPQDKNTKLKSPKSRKTKDNPYGIHPTSPFPEYVRPTVPECYHVHTALTALHGAADRPQSMPTASLTVAGCGEVPHVLDALIRTMLSGATTMQRANEALQRVVKEYGVDYDEKESVAWEKVAAGTQATLEATISCAGLGALKARHIMGMLEMVRDDNKASGRVDATGEGILSLDHLHMEPTEVAMRAMVRFPGVGVKTAACVSLFCLGRPCFAVDTHVLRLSTWLGWLPRKTSVRTRAPITTSMDDAFFHLDARVPDELKYGLHQLMIRHGQVCVRCSAATAEGTDRWRESECVLEEVMERVKKRVKGGVKVEGDGEVKVEGTASQVVEGEVQVAKAEEGTTQMIKAEVLPAATNGEASIPIVETTIKAPIVDTSIVEAPAIEATTIGTIEAPAIDTPVIESPIQPPGRVTRARARMMWG